MLDKFTLAISKSRCPCAVCKRQLGSEELAEYAISPWKSPPRSYGYVLATIYDVSQSTQREGLGAGGRRGHWGIARSPFDATSDAPYEALGTLTAAQAFLLKFTMQVKSTSLWEGHSRRLIGIVNVSSNRGRVESAPELLVRVSEAVPTFQACRRP